MYVERFLSREARSLSPRSCSNSDIGVGRKPLGSSPGWYTIYSA